MVNFDDGMAFAPDEFLAIYAGNLGVKQGLDVLLETAPLLRDPRIRILICGDGAQREALAQRVRELKLPNVSHAAVAGRRGLSRSARGRGCLLHHATSRSREFFFPEQTPGLLAESKPVVTVAAPECELALSLVEGKFGVNVPPGHAQELADLLDALAQDPARWLSTARPAGGMSSNSRRAAYSRRFAAELQILG